MTTGDDSDNPEHPGRPADDSSVPLLRALVSASIAVSAGISVLLQVGGILVSGRAVSWNTWMRSLGDSPAGDEMAQAVTRALTQAADDNDLPPPQPDEMIHLHLVDAVLLDLGSGQRVQVPAWQIPLEHIDGWTLGSI